MKTTGRILLILGILSFIGGITKGNVLVGPIFFIMLGCYLIDKSNKKEQEKKEQENWMKDKRGCDKKT